MTTRQHYTGLTDLAEVLSDKGLEVQYSRFSWFATSEPLLESKQMLACV